MQAKGGEYEHPKDEAIHRSQNCKECFTRAEELARQLGAATVGALYFLAALLESENEIITKALASFKISVPDFKEIVGKAARGEAIPVQKKKEKKEAAPASFLAAYGIDLTALAREGKLEPMIGRREELNKSAEMLREAARSIGF
ncbi:MAG: hypothetical protein NTX06_09510 [Proteobacteria bacterium]|nr:hypothetical protein [Pseudomonadota bacterium]